MAVQSIIPSFTVNNSGALRVCNSDALHFRHDSSSIIYYVHKNAHSTYWPKNAYILFDCVRVQFKRPNKQTKLPQQLNFRFAPLNRRHTVRQRMYSIAACHAWHTNNEYMRLRPSHHSTLCESQHTHTHRCCVHIQSSHRVSWHGLRTALSSLRSTPQCQQNKCYTQNSVIHCTKTQAVTESKCTAREEDRHQSSAFCFFSR